MTKTKKRLVACALFVTGVAAGFAPVRQARAAEAAGQLQCWHWIWQDDHVCSFCITGCDNGACCSTPSES
jgi:hypothetical protein